MSSRVFLEYALAEDVWNLERIKNILEKDPFSASRELIYPALHFKYIDPCPPLHFVVQNKNCSAALVELLLRNGARINEPSLNHENHTPLHLALLHGRDFSVVRALISNGANVDYYEESSLCAALSSGSSKDVIQLLLNMRSSVCDCTKEDHIGSVLHCAVDRPLQGESVSVEVLQKLMTHGANLNVVNQRFQTVLCYALEKGNDVDTIQWLLDKGVRCYQHASLLLCLTDRKHTRVRVSVIHALLRAGASPYVINSDGMMPLQCALLRCDSEKRAIQKLLRYHQRENINNILDDQRNGLLHLAVKNKKCDLSILELLIEEGVRVNICNREGKTPMEVMLSRDSLAQKYDSYDAGELNILKFFLRHEEKVTTKTVRVAVENCNDLEVVKFLLDEVSWTLVGERFFRSLIKIALDKASIFPRQMRTLTYLIKSYFLRFSCYHMHFLNPKHAGEYESLFAFRHRLVKELVNMKTQKIGRTQTLHNYLISSRGPNQRCNFDRLLNIIKEFPNYREFIMDKMSRPQMEEKLQYLPFYFRKKARNAHVGKKVYFPYEITLEVSQYLKEDKDLSGFIVAFANSDGNKSNAVESKGMKRKAEEPDRVEDCKRCCFLLKGPKKN